MYSTDTQNIDNPNTLPEKKSLIRIIFSRHTAKSILFLAILPQIILPFILFSTILALPLLLPLIQIIYGYNAFRKKPAASFSEKYVPVLIPVFYYLILFLVFMVINKGDQLAGNHWSAYVFLTNIIMAFIIPSEDLWVFILPVLAYLYSVLGYIIGDVVGTNRRKQKFPKFNPKPIAAVFLTAVICLVTVYPLYREANSNRIITSRVSEQGHGFDYENGYSSINLYPYYIQNKNNILAKLDEEPSYIIEDFDNMPALDGAEAAFPLYSAFANFCYKDIGEILKDVSNAVPPVDFTNTVVSFERLINGDVDIFFGAEPSEEQKSLAEAQGKELVLTPVAYDAFVFIVNPDNKINSLTQEQIRSIYSGEYRNWNQAGGADSGILAFQRPDNSGSQTIMKKFMGGIPLMEPLEGAYHDAMMGTVTGIADYNNDESAIGYSFRFYTTGMINYISYQDVKLLEIDGIPPSAENIRNKTYPLTTTLYAVTLKDNRNEYISGFLDWMTSPQGQKIVEDTGYIPLS